MRVTEFNPPISSRETEELIAIANGTTDEWQQEAIEQAKDELRKRDISKDYQKKVLDKWKEEGRQSELAYQKQLEQNETEGYSIGKMIYIFLVGPFILGGKWTVDLSLQELKRENYQRKFKQRLFLLLCGVAFWILLFVAIANEYKKKWQEEVDNVDISEWEMNYHGNDSLKNNDNSKNDSVGRGLQVRPE